MVGGGSSPSPDVIGPRRPGHEGLGTVPNVINLCADKRAVFDEIRCATPGGWLQFADIANGRPVP